MKRKLQRKEPIRLTEDIVARLKIPPGKTDETWFDSDIKGFGVRKRGDHAVYILQYQLNGKTSSLRLGKCSEIRCDVARLALAKRGEISKARLNLGIDPATDRENTKAESRKPKAKTLGDIVPVYLEWAAKEQRPRTYGQTVHRLTAHWRPLHDLPVNTVSRGIVASQLATIAKRSGPVAANRARAALSAMFRWA